MHSYLASLYLADKATALCFSMAIRLQAKALDMCVRRRAVVALVALDFTDLNHVGDGLTKPRVFKCGGRVCFCRVSGAI